MLLDKKSILYSKSISLFFANASKSRNYIAGATDLQFQYTHQTELSVHLAGFKSLEDALGKTAFDIQCPAVESAKKWHQQTEQAMKEKKLIEVLDIHRFNNGFKSFITQIVPIFQNSTLNVAGSFHCLQSLKLQNTSKKILKLFNPPSIYSHINRRGISLELVDNYNELNLSIRESECFFYVINRYSNKMIAKELKLSVRTIDDYIENTRHKIGCRDRYEILDYAIDFNLLNKIPRSLLQLDEVI